MFPCVTSFGKYASVTDQRLNVQSELDEVRHEIIQFCSVNHYYVTN